MLCSLKGFFKSCYRDTHNLIIYVSLCGTLTIGCSFLVRCAELAVSCSDPGGVCRIMDREDQ